MLNFHSLKFRMIALGVVLMLAGLVMRQFIALPQMQDNVRDLVAAQQLSIANYIARDIDHSVTTQLALIQQLAADMPPALARQPEKLQAWMKERQRTNPMFNSGLLAVRPDGKGLLGEYPVAGRAELDFTQTDWFLSAVRENKAIIGKPLRSRATGEPVIVFAAPVHDAAGKLVMVLGGSSTLNASGFLDRMQVNRLGATGGFLLISPQDKLFVGSSDPAMILKPTPPAGVNLLHDRAMAGYRGTGVTVNAKGVEELSAMVTVPSTGWFVVARMPTKEAFRPVESMRVFMMQASIAMLVVILVVLLIALPRILRPLSSASAAIHDMADGKTAIAPLPVARNDEVGTLVRGFNYLVARLRNEETARKASESRLEFMAHHDPLTGLCNRAMLDDRLGQALARSERAGTQIAMLYCDLDGFKPVNDEYGHDTGDAVLCKVAQRIAHRRRRTDTVARVGGDEFVILLADLVDARMAADAVAKQCLEAVGTPLDIDDKMLSLGMSIGVVLHSGASVTPAQLMSIADNAMYQAKRAGKGGVFVVDQRSVAEPAPLAMSS
jgi:diguanylate cyclase (GGDEF)-like protein